MLHLNIDLKEAIHLANKSAISLTRAVAMNVSPWRGRLISHEHVITAAVCIVSAIRDAVEPQICKSSNWNTICFLLKEKWSPRHKIYSVEKQMSRMEPFESFRVPFFLEYFFELGAVLSISFEIICDRPLRRFGSCHLSIYANKCGNVKNVKWFLYASCVFSYSALISNSVYFTVCNILDSWNLWSLLLTKRGSHMKTTKN